MELFSLKERRRTFLIHSFAKSKYSSKLKYRRIQRLGTKSTSQCKDWKKRQVIRKNERAKRKIKWKKKKKKREQKNCSLWSVFQSAILSENHR